MLTTDRAALRMLLGTSVAVPPTAKGRPRFSRRSGRAFTPAATQAAERTLRGEFAEAVQVSDAARGLAWPMTGPLALDLEFLMPIPLSWSMKKTGAARRNDLPHTSRPDVDNLGKLVMDAANGILWVDDSQLVSVRMEKRYASGQPATVLRLYQVGDA